MFIECKVSPYTSSPSWPILLASRLWQITFSKMDPIPYVLLQCDLSTLSHQEVKSISLLLQSGWAQQLPGPIEYGRALNWPGASYFLPPQTQLSWKNTNTLTPSNCKKPQACGEALENEMPHKERSQGAPRNQIGE